jgi:hypothetical protein
VNKKLAIEVWKALKEGSMADTEKVSRNVFGKWKRRAGKQEGGRIMNFEGRLIPNGIRFYTEYRPLY